MGLRYKAEFHSLTYSDMRPTHCTKHPVWSTSQFRTVLNWAIANDGQNAALCIVRHSVEYKLGSYTGDRWKQVCWNVNGMYQTVIWNDTSVHTCGIQLERLIFIFKSQKSKVKSRNAKLKSFLLSLHQMVAFACGVLCALLVPQIEPSKDWWCQCRITVARFSHFERCDCTVRTVVSYLTWKFYNPLFQLQDVELK